MKVSEDLVRMVVEVHWDVLDSQGSAVIRECVLVVTWSDGGGAKH